MCCAPTSLRSQMHDLSHLKECPCGWTMLFETSWFVDIWVILLTNTEELYSAVRRLGQQKVWEWTGAEWKADD